VQCGKILETPESVVKVLLVAREHSSCTVGGRGHSSCTVGGRGTQFLHRWWQETQFLHLRILRSSVFSDLRFH